MGGPLSVDTSNSMLRYHSAWCAGAKGEANNLTVFTKGGQVTFGLEKGKTATLTQKDTVHTYCQVDTCILSADLKVSQDTTMGSISDATILDLRAGQMLVSETTFTVTVSGTFVFTAPQLKEVMANGAITEVPFQYLDARLREGATFKNVKVEQSRGLAIIDKDGKVTIDPATKTWAQKQGVEAVRSPDGHIIFSGGTPVDAKGNSTPWFSSTTLPTPPNAEPNGESQRGTPPPES
jgi:hypothetical protein